MSLIISIYVNIDGSSYNTCNQCHFDLMLIELMDQIVIDVFDINSIFEFIRLFYNAICIRYMQPKWEIVEIFSKMWVYIYH